MRRRQRLAAKRAEAKTETVREEYERVFGEKPHWNMKEETMRERLDDAGHDRA